MVMVLDLDLDHDHLVEGPHESCWESCVENLPTSHPIPSHPTDPAAKHHITAKVSFPGFRDSGPRTFTRRSGANHPHPLLPALCRTSFWAIGWGSLNNEVEKVRPLSVPPQPAYSRPATSRPTRGESASLDACVSFNSFRCPQIPLIIAPSRHLWLLAQPSQLNSLRGCLSRCKTSGSHETDSWRLALVQSEPPRSGVLHS